MMFPLSHSLSLSTYWVPVTLFPLMIALRRGGVPKIRCLKLLLGRDLMIQPSGLLGNLTESKILDEVVDSYVDESSDRADGRSERIKIAYCKRNARKMSVVLLTKCPEPLAGEGDNRME